MVNVGHGVREIAEALACQAAKVAYVSGTVFTHDAVEEFAAELARVSPGDLNLVYPLGSGSEAVEAGSKLARQYWVESGRAGKHKILAFMPSVSREHAARAVRILQRIEPRALSRRLVDVLRVPAPYPYRCSCEGKAALCPTCSGDAVEQTILREAPGPSPP